MSIENILLYGSLLLFVGSPTTIGAALAIRIAIRGGAHLARMIAASSVTGVVATTAAFIYMTAQGGGGAGAVPGFPGIPASALQSEEITLTFVELRDSHYFEFEGNLLELEAAEKLLFKAVGIGKVRKVRIADTVKHTGGKVLHLRETARNQNLEFEIEEL